MPSQLFYEQTNPRRETLAGGSFALSRRERLFLPDRLFRFLSQSLPFAQGACLRSQFCNTCRIPPDRLRCRPLSGPGRLKICPLIVQREGDAFHCRVYPYPESHRHCRLMLHPKIPIPQRKKKGETLRAFGKLPHQPAQQACPRFLPDKPNAPNPFSPRVPICREFRLRDILRIRAGSVNRPGRPHSTSFSAHGVCTFTTAFGPAAIQAGALIRTIPLVSLTTAVCRLSERIISSDNMLGLSAIQRTL